MMIIREYLARLLAFRVASGIAPAPASAQQQQQKPNILVIMGDDIGYWNISAYNRGMMGYRTPNIDRIANEGAIFTDYYGQQSCTAGRAAFITGQSPMRTGLLKVGLPGAKEGLSDKDPTLAELLKPLGYMTGQFGKNHLGDRNEFLPTVHGFDEFFGNLYHLNAEDEPEHPDYPKNSEFKLRFGPRGVLRCTATIAETPGEDPRFGKWGKQSCTDTGPLTKKRMETVDQEFLDGDARLHRPRQPGQEAVLRVVQFDPHAHLDPPQARVPGQDRARHLPGRHGGARRPGRPASEEARRSRHRQQHHRDLHHRQRCRDLHLARRRHHAVPRREEHQLGGQLPRAGAGTLARSGGSRAPRSTISSRPRTGCRPSWRPRASPTSRTSSCRATAPAARPSRCTSTATTSATCFAGKGPDKRREFFYWTDDGNLAGLRYDQYKAVFMEQQAHGLEVWMQPLVPLRAPKLFNLRSDPFERAEHEAGDYDKWFIEHAFVLVPAQAIVAQHLATFQEFPPRQKPGSFSVDQAMEKLSGPEQQQLTAASRLEGAAKMKRTFASFSISRRVLLCGLCGVRGLVRAVPPRSAPAQTAGDPLPSWNDGPAKQAIVDFVRATTDTASPNFVPPGGHASPRSIRTARSGSSIRCTRR